MSHDDDVPRTPEQLAAFMDGLSFEPAPAPQDEQARAMTFCVAFAPRGGGLTHGTEFA